VGQRFGFSLIEILVVIGLIAFLTAAIVAVIPRVGNAAKVAATKATIKKVDELLNDRINGFRRWISKQDTLAGGNAPSYVTNSPYAGMYQANALQAKALAVKYAFRLYFPQRFSEFQTPITPPRQSQHNLVTESSASLYQFLTTGPLFDTEPPSAADLKIIETADTDDDGLPEIVDGWGQPLRFYRSPTRLVRPATTSTGLTGSGSTSSASGSTPGPIDEVPLISPSPLTLAMSGVAPRPSLPQWQASHAYTVGAQIASPSLAGTGYSVVYQCVVGGTSGSGASPLPTTAPTVGKLVPDQSPLQWQALLDPLSVDPDDPFGVAAGFIGETASATTLFIPLTPNTWCVPLIVSCGSDGLLGLFEPVESADPANPVNFGMLAQPQADTSDPTGFNRTAMYDNITNHQP
jgi:type II secretory pathway pseudopilin PulG